ncbi:MAG: type II secretion system protein [Candidatus Krumholzibacteria bacterium]|nr:type II secretion system protein [Candidatus Krumholzibacteria bacterium]
MMRSNKGLSLVEIMIAILIFGIGITAAIRTLPVSNRATTRARNLTLATNLAQQKIEELMNLPTNDADLTGGAHNDPDNPVDRIFTRTWVVADNSPIVDMKRVDVTVVWTADGSDNGVSLTTYLTSRR